MLFPIWKNTYIHKYIGLLYFFIWKTIFCSLFRGLIDYAVEVKNVQMCVAFAWSSIE